MDPVIRLQGHPGAKHPIDTERKLSPSHVFYLQETSGRNYIAKDITGKVNAEDGLNESDESANAFVTAAKAAAAEQTAMAYRLERSGRIFTKHRVVEGGSGSDADTEVATLTGGVGTHGNCTLKFPEGSPHGSHDVHVRPSGLFSRTDEFVSEGVPFFWNMVDGARLAKLYGALESSRIEVARVMSMRSRDREGLLLVDDSQLNGIVVLGTWVAELNRIESFRY